MKLFQLEPHTYFQITDGSYGEKLFYLERLDGAFSVCYTREKELVHLSANTPVKEYELLLA